MTHPIHDVFFIEFTREALDELMRTLNRDPIINEDGQSVEWGYTQTVPGKAIIEQKVIEPATYTTVESAGVAEVAQ